MNRRLCIGTSAVAAMLAVGPAVAEGAASPAVSALAGIEGRAIVSIHDGDMLASAYVNGRLGPTESPDALTVLSLSDLSVATIPVSNSVAGAPTAVAATPDGRFVVVSESFGARPAEAETFRDLPTGSRLTLVDISDLARPEVVDTADIGTRPDGLSLNAGGTLAAVALHPRDGRGIAFVPLDGNRLGDVSYATLPAIGAAQRISHVEWHPTGDFIAIHTVDEALVHFARVVVQDGSVGLEPWGNPVRTSKYPFMGRFTPDGTLYLTGNLFWGPDVPGTWTEAVDGDVMAIRFDAAPAEGDPRHLIVGRAPTGASPEGIAISPDGRWAVTTNLEISYAPVDDPRHTPYASLTLLAIDPAAGSLETAGTYYFDGILPEAATFDASGRYVAVVNFDQHVGGAPGGSIDFWRLIDGNAPKLVKTRTSVPVSHGPHSTTLVN